MQPPSAPPAALLTGHLGPFGSDPLGFLETCVREHGDFVPLRFFHRRVYLLNDAGDIEQVLAGHSRHFRKTLGYRTPFMRRLFGEGLLTSEGDFWLRQRRLSQPAFHKERIAGYGAIIQQYTDEATACWKHGEVRDIHQEMMRLTARVVTKTLFNADVSNEIENLGEASEAVMKQFTVQWSVWRLFASLFRTRTRKRFNEVMRRIDDFIYRLIATRRADGIDAGDLLSMLLLTRDDDGSGMTDRQLRDELTTLMVAGLDTTALALSWAFYLLARNPAGAANVFHTIQIATNGKIPTVSDIPSLGGVERVIKESMRLYPPAWIVGREATVDCKIGNHSIRKGDSLIMSQWLKHRDARHFKDPASFVPERWNEASVRDLPRFAYFPFGGGPRICIGSGFALLEAILVLARVFQQFAFEPATPDPVSPWPAITLQPKGGVKLRILRR